MEKVFLNETGDILHIRVQATFKRRKNKKMIVSPDGRDLTKVFNAKVDNPDG